MTMSNVDVEIEVPKELTDEMEILSTIINPIMKNVGVLIMGEHFHSNHGINTPAIRLYVLKKSGSKFFVESELEAFAFHNFDAAQSFLARLPEMKALEILMLMNGIQLDTEGENVTYQ